MKTLFVALAVGYLVSVGADASELSESDVDATRAKCASYKEAGEDLLLAACAFGYAEAGCAKKAETCAAEVKLKYPQSPLNSILVPGFLKMPCSECLAIPDICQRCLGSGKVVTLKGSAPGKCIVCGGAGSVKARCETCKGSGESPMSKSGCYLLYKAFVRDTNGLLKNMLDSKTYMTKYVDVVKIEVSLARTRMNKAERLEGRVVDLCKNGVILRLSRIFDVHGTVEKNGLAYVEGGIARTTEGEKIICVAFWDSTVETTGDERTVIPKYVTCEWDGLLQDHTPKTPERSDRIMGIPVSVYQSIRAKAEREWPDDYGMQKHRIESEIKAYKALQRPELTELQ